MSPVYKCAYCQDAGYSSAVPPVEPCPSCERGERVAAMLGRQPWVDPAAPYSPSTYDDSEPACHASQSAATSTSTIPGESLSPSAVARLLKIALYLGAGWGVWWMLRLNSDAGTESDVLEAGAEEPDGNDYSSWEPQQ